MFTERDCWYKNVCTKLKTDPTSCTACFRFYEMTSLMAQSNIPENRWEVSKLRADADIYEYNYLRDLKSTIKDWVQNGNNIYIYSTNCGNGKTSWAIKLMQAYFDKVWIGNGGKCRGVFISVPTFLVRNKEIINKFDDDFANLKSKLLDADLVIWDDIASTKLSEFDHSLLLAYVDSRILSGKANIFTGNVIPANLTDYVGERLASRILSNCALIQFQNRDMRGCKR